jgi:two-component system response regulator AdeR
MVTALGEDLEKLMALNCGADDYVVKPFNPLEVVARAKAVLRRSQGSGEPASIIRVDALEVDLAAHSAKTLTIDGQSRPLDLTLTEFRILAHMARAPDKAYSRSDLLDACLPSDGDALDRTVDSHLSNLRRKLATAGCPDMLPAVRGVGYRLRP